MINEKLTGQTRYRLHNPIFGAPLLVLQVEVEWGEGDPDFNGMPSYPPGKGWRDAKVSDLTTRYVETL